MDQTKRTRELEIELMKTAATRAQASFETWMRDPKVRVILHQFDADQHKQKEDRLVAG
jgi:hypothetical protein